MKNDLIKAIKIAVPLAIVSVIAIVSERLLINTTNSVEHVFMYRADDSPSRGDYVTFKFYHPYIALAVGEENKRDYRLTKKLMCLPGDSFETQGDLHYCNGEEIDKALKETGSGLPLHAFQYNGSIPAGKGYVLADSGTSFDSRYWGFIELSKLEKVVPIL